MVKNAAAIASVYVAACAFIFAREFLLLVRNTECPPKRMRFQSRLRSLYYLCCNSTLFSFLELFKHLIRASYTVGTVGRTFRRLPSSSAQPVQFPIFRARNGVSFPFRRNGTECNRHRFMYMYTTTNVCVA